MLVIITTKISKQNNDYKVLNEENKKIILVGNLGKDVSGSSISFSRYYQKLLQNRINNELINTHRERINTISNFLILIKVILQILIKINKCNLLAFNADEVAFMKFGPIIFLISRLFKKKIVSRCFGGSLDLHHKKANRVWRNFFNLTILKSEVLFLQTKYLINYFSSFKNTNLLHLPTTRKKNSHFTNKSSKARKFLFIGRLSRKKGIYDLNEATVDMNIDITIDMYGSIENDIDIEIFNNNQFINYLGKFCNDKVYEIMNNYDVLILPTYYEGEGYPGAIIEAFHSHLPIITTKWRAIPEIVDSSCGILVKINSPIEIKNAIIKIYEDENFYKKLKNGSKLNSEFYNEDYWINYYIEQLNQYL